MFVLSMCCALIVAAEPILKIFLPQAVLLCSESATSYSLDVSVIMVGISVLLWGV